MGILACEDKKHEDKIYWLISHKKPIHPIQDRLELSRDFVIIDY
jgi:hypothetical protein